MSDDKVDSWWTDEDVERASEAAWFYFKSQDGGNPNAHEALLAAMNALAPRVTEIVDRERRAAKVEALREIEEVLLAPTPGRLVDGATCRYFNGYVASMRRKAAR